MKGSNQAGAGLSPLGRWKGRTKAVARHRPLDRWTGQTKLARVWSVGSVERSNQAGGGHRPLEPMEGSDGPLPGFGRWSGALTLSGSREFKGRPRDNKTIGSVQLKPPFPRSIDKVSTGARGVHQATAPSTQLVGCDGDWPACRALSVGTDEHRLAHGMVRGADGRVKTKLAHGMVGWYR